MYGPLASIMSPNYVTFLTCFVLTKVSHENRRVIYAGFPTEISLREGNNIDHMVIANPEKFYLRLNRDTPKTSFDKARRMSAHEFSQGYMYVSGSEIENVNFDGFYFERDGLFERVSHFFKQR